MSIRLRSFIYIYYFVLICLLIRGGLGKDDDDYAVVIDAGSTGSRGYIFTFTTNDAGKRHVLSQKGPKVEPGLSSTETHEEVLVEYFLPIFIEASKHIPESAHSRTSAYIKGTAGMRLLSAEDQDKLWRAVYHGLTTHPDFKFRLRLENLGTIDGHMEAYYAVLSSNYIEGSIDADLVPQAGTDMVGALDMGGSSTQLIFHAGRSMELGEPVKQEDFWSHSWLNFGVERVRERVWELIARQYLEKEGVATMAEVEVTVGGDSSPAIQLSNPCVFPGHESLWNDTYLMRGTGDSTRCVQLIKQIMWPADEAPTSTDQNDGSVSTSRYVDDVPHPPLKGHFYGMSVYFYALDCVRALGPFQLLDWPSPRIDDLEHAAHQFCGLPWPHVQSSLLDKHAFTKNAQLPHRCLESLYIVTLLEHGFGMHGQSQNITLALDVKGMEVEWTLGFALAEIIPSIDHTLVNALSTLQSLSNSSSSNGNASLVTQIKKTVSNFLTLIRRLPLRWFTVLKRSILGHSLSATR